MKINITFLDWYCCYSQSTQNEKFWRLKLYEKNIFKFNHKMAQRSFKQQFQRFVQSNSANIFTALTRHSTLYASQRLIMTTNSWDDLFDLWFSVQKCISVSSFSPILTLLKFRQKMQINLNVSLGATKL